MAKFERRLAPIVSLDVAGYSRLIQRDELATLNAVQSLFRDQVEATIGEHGGTIFVDGHDSVHSFDDEMTLETDRWILQS